MPDLPPESRPDRSAAGATDSGMPRWVKVFGLVALVLVVAFLVMHLAGGGLGHHGM